jgi:dTDP-glucose 4,6-dehydratase
MDNVYGTHVLLQASKEYGKLKRFLHFSTDEVYGDCESCSHKETDILKPSNPYSATKASADMLILGWHRTYGNPYLIVRPTNNYGIGQHTEKLIPRTIKHLNLGKKIELHNNGTPIRTWLHAQDTADAVISLIEAGVKNTIYNISGDFETTNIDVVQKILNTYLDGFNYNIDDFVDFSYNRPGQDVRYSLDDTKLKNLGWKPIRKFDLELKIIVNKYKYKLIW